MAETKSTGLRWIAILAALAVIAIGGWLTLGVSQRRDAVGEEGPAAGAPMARPAPSPAPASGDSAIPGLRIAARGRLTLERDALPDGGPLTLALDLADDARGSGDRSVRVVSTDGRRIDLTASPLPGSGSGLRLEIDSGFLSPGRYLIEVETVEEHPLRIRRYVLELK